MAIGSSDNKIPRSDTIGALEKLPQSHPGEMSIKKFI